MGAPLGRLASGPRRGGGVWMISLAMVTMVGEWRLMLVKMESVVSVVAG